MAVCHVQFSKFAISSRGLYLSLILRHPTSVAFIGQYGAEIKPKTIFNMASVCYIGFVVTLLCCVWVLHFMYLTLYKIFKSFGFVFSYIIGLLAFRGILV